MDGEAGWWTTSGNTGLLPLARVMGVGRQQHDNLTDQAPSSSCSPSVDELLNGKRLVPPSSPTVDELAYTSWQSLDDIISVVSPPYMLPGRGILMKFDDVKINNYKQLF